MTDTQKITTQYALECFDLSKRFKTIQALENVSLQVPVGSIFGFLGPNGAGKSTLIRVIAGLIKSDAGHFNIFGRSSRTGYKVRQDMSTLVDRADFYKNLSAFQNMKILGRLTGHEQDDRINGLLDQLGLYDRRGDKVKTYSQGMKQRLGLAQALLPDPKLLILDEPTTGLDPKGMHEIRDFIVKIAEEQNVTIFLSSHLLHEVELICSDIALIFNGKLAAQGSIKTIFNEMEAVSVELEASNTEQALAFLSKSDLCSEIHPLSNAIGFKIDYNQIPDLIRDMSSNGIDIFSISQRNRLENFFLSLMDET